MDLAKVLNQIIVKPGDKARLDRRPTDWRDEPDLAELSKKELKGRAQEIMARSLEELQKAQEALWADDRWSLLVVLQAMDAAGKDGAIKHVMSGVNPQGCTVHAFKAPSAEELDHSFLWRCMKAAPARGQITIFNRSHYEEVLVVRVNPALLDRQQLPPGARGPEFWAGRFEDINNFERHLSRTGTRILKFFLHLGKDEQKRRLLARLDDPEKNWKFDSGDLDSRAKWDDYAAAYEEAITATSTAWAPWHVVPADSKWAARAILSATIAGAISALDLKPPKATEARVRELAEARRRLESE